MKGIKGHHETLQKQEIKINAGTKNPGILFNRKISVIYPYPIPATDLTERKINEIIIERVLLTLEFETDPQHPNILLFGCSKTIFADKADSAVSAAKIIFEAATEYIYEQYKMLHPEMKKSKFEEYKTRVIRGIDKGLRESKNILIALGADAISVRDKISKIEEPLLSRMQDFFDDESQRF